MRKIDFFSCSLLSMINVFMYVCLEVVEQITFVGLRAYLSAQQMGYNEKLLYCNFERPKVIVSILAIFFLLLAIISLCYKMFDSKI